MEPNKLFTFIPYWRVKVTKPTNGVFTEKGYRFYHVFPVKLTDEEKGLLEKEGISINESSKFSPDEDKQIRENWKSYCDVIGESVDSDVFHQIGFIVPTRVEPLKRHEITSSVSHGIWPILCANMEDRTARQIQRRMSLIFDKFYNGNETISDENRQKIESNLFTNIEEVVEMSEELEIPFALMIDERIDLKMRILTRTSKRWIFETVLKFLPISEMQLLEMLSKRSFKTIEKKVNRYIDWGEITRLNECLKNEEEAKKAWNAIMYELAVTYDEYSLDYESNDASAIESKWKTCKHVVLRIDFERDDMLLVLRCLYNTAKKDASEFLMVNFDIEKLKEKLEKCGSSHLFSKNFDNSSLIKSIRVRMYKADRLLFRHLVPQPNLKEKLMILTETLVRLNFFQKMSKRTLFPRDFTNNVLFTVVYQYYSMRYDWEPPEQLAHFAGKTVSNATFDLLIAKHGKTITKAAMVATDSLEYPTDRVKMDKKIISKSTKTTAETTESQKPQKVSIAVTSRIRTRVLDGNVSNTWKRRKVEVVEASSSADENMSISDATELSMELVDEPTRGVTFGQTTRIFYSNSDREAEEEATENNRTPLPETSNMTEISLEESVLAGGGDGWNKTANISGDDGTLEFDNNKSGFDSLIINIPEIDESKLKKEVAKPILPSKPTDNWLDIVNMFG